MAASGGVSGHRTAALAERYAKAVLAAAADSAERVTAELAGLAGALAADAEARFFFAGPGVGRARRRAAVDGMAADLGLSDVAASTLRVLVDAERMDLLPQVASALRMLADRSAGRVRARMTVASPADAAGSARVAAALGRILGAAVVIEEEVDPSILGGARVEAGNLLIDGTVAGRLARLRDALR